MTCPHSSINRRTPSSCTLWPFPWSSWSCLYKLDAAGINNPSVLLIIIVLTISGPAALVFQGWPMVPHQTHLRIYSVAPSASEPSQPQSIRAGLYCDSTGGSSATEFAANPHFSIYTVGGAILAWASIHTKSSSFHQMWEQQVQVLLDLLPRGALGAFLCLLWYYATRNH